MPNAEPTTTPIEDAAKIAAKALDTAVRQQLRDEIGDEEITQDRKFILLQKYGIAKPVLDKQLDNPGWVPEKSEEGGDTWKRRKQNWLSLINQAKKARR